MGAGPRGGVDVRGGAVLYAFGFERIAVVVCDLYFRDPDPGPGQEGAERGVRVEVRRLVPGDLHGSIYSAQPIAIDEPIWRGDLLESVDGPVGSFDRTHHHPRFRGWEPGSRRFVPELSAAPLEWLEARLADLPALLEEARVDPSAAGPDDAEQLRRAVPEILDAVRRLLAGIAAGDLARPPADATASSIRAGWL
jgi:hypothetical protein